MTIHPTKNRHVQQPFLIISGNNFVLNKYLNIIFNSLIPYIPADQFIPCEKYVSPKLLHLGYENQCVVGLILQIVR